MKKYDISVIIPLHNTDLGMFANCVASWKTQTIGFENVQWIVVLHNCNGETLSGVHALLDGYENILLEELNNEVHSPSSPRNRGMDIAGGEYISFLDADDMYTPECLATALRYIRASDAEICHFRKKIQMEKEGGLLLNELVLWDQTREMIVVDHDSWEPEKLFVGTWAMSTAKLYRRSFLKEHNLHFDETIKFAEDYHFIMSVYGKARRICLAPQLIGYIYFVNGQSLVQTTQMTEGLILDYVHGFRKIFENGLANGIWMNDTMATMMLLVVIWIRMCPGMSAEARQEIRDVLEPYIRMLKPIRPSKIYLSGRSDRANTLLSKIILNEEPEAGTFIDRAEETPGATVLDRQRDALAAVIKNGMDSDFSRRYGFRGILTIEDYAKRIPVCTYDELEPIVRLMTEIGERGIITDREVTSYALAFDGLGIPRRIPFTAEALGKYVETFREMIGTGVTFMMMESLPFKSSGLTMDNKYTNTVMGLVLTAYVSEALKSAGGHAAFTTPGELLFPTRLFDMEYIRLLFALRERRLETIFAPNAWVLAAGLKLLEKEWDSFCRDIETGRISQVRDNLPQEILDKVADIIAPNPERAAELRGLFRPGEKLRVSAIWPGLKRVIANSTGSYRCYRKAAKEYLGDIPLSDGFLADEFAVYGVADPEGGFVLDPDSAYFEFLAQEGPEAGSAEKTLTAAQLREGESYSVLVSNLSGLYRYRTRMQLRCLKADEKQVRVLPLCPVLFDRQQMCGLREEDAYEAAMACAGVLDAEIADFTLMRDGDGFALALEPADEAGYLRLAAADRKKAAEAAEAVLCARSAAYPAGRLEVYACEPETHLLYRDMEQYKKHVAQDAVSPCHITDSALAVRFFNQKKAR